jgi:hypothetical protein
MNPILLTILGRSGTIELGYLTQLNPLVEKLFIIKTGSGTSIKHGTKFCLIHTIFSLINERKASNCGETPSLGKATDIFIVKGSFISLNTTLG